MHRERKTASQAEQQREVDSAGHTITDSRKKSVMLDIAILAKTI